MALHPETWLFLAKGLAVGQQGRYPHMGDRTNRANLVVYNSADRWSCFCMSCKQGGVVFKRHVTFSTPAPQTSTVLTLPADMTKVTHLPEDTKREVLAFLVRKNMDALYIPCELMYSDDRKRLLMQTHAGWLGRDLTENSHQKWLTYNGSQYLEARQGGDTAVVVEDPFSFFKVAYADKTRSVYCALGTRVRPGLLLKLIKHRRVVFYMDGDAAGQEGAVQGARRVRAYGVQALEHCAPWGFDPKDQNCPDIRKHLAEV